MAVFKVHGTGSTIFWSLHREGTSGDIGPVIAEGPGSFADKAAAIAAVNEVRGVALGAQLVIEEDVDILSGDNMRVGSPRVEAKRLPATPLASPSPLATEDDLNDNDDDGAPVAAAKPPVRRVPAAGRPSSARPPSAAKPRANRAKPTV
ncbi:MAG TPA: hypothetical protein VII47_16265 [Actinomycetota bacterium]